MKTGNPRNNLSPQLSLDHIQVMASPAAREIQLFRERGFFIPDVVTRHPGFGTSGRGIYFRNFHLELHWIEDKNAFAKNMLRLYNNKKRALTRTRVGVALYNTLTVESPLPFETKSYCREWMNPGSCLKVANIEDESAPLYYILPKYMALSDGEMKKRIIRPLSRHENNIRRLSKVTMFLKGREPTNVEMHLNRLGIIQYQPGKSNHIELEFDNNKSGKEINLIKELSITIKH